jgi:hypothetical protein
MIKQRFWVPRIETNHQMWKFRKAGNAGFRSRETVVGMEQVYEFGSEGLPPHVNTASHEWRKEETPDWVQNSCWTQAS